MYVAIVTQKLNVEDKKMFQCFVKIQNVTNMKSFGDPEI